MLNETCAVTDAGITVGLCGPEPRTLWIVSEGSRQRDVSEAAERCVTASSRRKSAASSSSCGLTLSSASKKKGWLAAIYWRERERVFRSYRILG